MVFVQPTLADSKFEHPEIDVITYKLVLNPRNIKYDLFMSMNTGTDYMAVLTRNYYDIFTGTAWWLQSEERVIELQRQQPQALLGITRGFLTEIEQNRLVGEGLRERRQFVWETHTCLRPLLEVRMDADKEEKLAKLFGVSTQ
jgi:hypothetical protein